MKKLLSLLSVLTISGTAVPTTIAASPYQKEEIIKNSDINYQQTNNLEKLNRNKRSKNYNKPQRGNTPLYQSGKYNLKKWDDYLNYLAFCYFYAKAFWYHGGLLKASSVKAYTGNDYSVLKSGLRTLSGKFSFKVLKSKVINNNNNKEKVWGEGVLENNLDEYQQLSTTPESVSFEAGREFKISAGIKTGLKVNADLLLGSSEASTEINLGTEYTKNWKTIKTFTLPSSSIKVKPNHRVYYKYYSKPITKLFYGIARIKIDPNQYISFVNHETNKRFRIKLSEAINYLIYYYGYKLFNDNTYLKVTKNSIYANTPYKLKKIGYTNSKIKITKEEKITNYDYEDEYYEDEYYEDEYYDDEYYDDDDE